MHTSITLPSNEKSTNLVQISCLIRIFEYCLTYNAHDMALLGLIRALSYIFGFSKAMKTASVHDLKNDLKMTFVYRFFRRRL